MDTEEPRCQGLKATDVLAINPFENARIRIPKVAPGGSVAITVPGKYPTETVVLSERDGVTLSDAAMSAASYSTRMVVAPDEGPGFARLFAMTPISFDQNQTFLAVAFIDAVYRVDLKSANGMTVRVTPLDKSFTIDQFQKNARAKYQAEFYKPGETRPFETIIGYQDFSNATAPSGHFDIEFSQSANSPQEELESINRTLADPKTTAAQRNKLMERIGQIQQKMAEDIVKALKTDPASANKQQDDFGCGSLQLYPDKVGTVTGAFSCGKNFNGGTLTVTGTMTQVK